MSARTLPVNRSRWIVRSADGSGPSFDMLSWLIVQTPVWSDGRLT
ncbi:hypothetical protein [uncultured Tateyamaria sp.]|nr:hypothetical protein [uncultured Tateyamaria sp.]